MKLIIDIPEDVFKRTVFYREFRDLNDCVTTIKALENGTPLSEELEKIKAELYNKSFSYSLTENFENDIVIGVIKVSDMEKILDNHIYELKGENK